MAGPTPNRVMSTKSNHFVGMIVIVVIDLGALISQNDNSNCTVNNLIHQTCALYFQGSQKGLDSHW